MTSLASAGMVWQRKWMLLTGLLMVSSAAMAQTAPNPQGAANGNKTAEIREDGKMTSAQAAHRLSFQRADMNNDGMLSRQEAQNLPAIFEKFNEWDHDGDGNISEEEFLKRASVGSKQ